MTYSDLGVYIHGGSPESDYSVAYDPAGANRTYVETDVHIDMTDAEQYDQMAEVFANYGISPPPDRQSGVVEDRNQHDANGDCPEHHEI